MAGNIRDIKVNVTGDTSALKASLKEVNSELSSTQKELNAVDKLLKLDPKNTEILAQKQGLLAQQIQTTEQKLQALKAAKDKAEEVGINSDAQAETYRELQREIAKTEASLRSLTDQSASTEKALGGESDAIADIGKNSDSSVSGVGRLSDIIKGNLISQAIIGGVKALGSALLDIGKGLFNVGKQAVESYAEYEQLVGGVETLFKDGSDELQQYASEAYKTSGLSANEYMSTVTSFAASLNNSVIAAGGTMADAAKLADQAVVDMADNANKMGTDIGSLQNAYQGFAKQNYTMLDNLKLGYGGTKTEMERLIADANQLKVAQGEVGDLSIESYADIVEAIHTVQNEMGITGTTALEASQTISGSVSSMKAAWSNLLTGIADDNVDFGALIDNFIDSFLTMMENILPRISVALDGIIELIVQLADKLLPQILQLGLDLLTKLIEGIVSNIDSIANAVTTIVVEFTKTLITLLPQIIDAGIKILLALITGIAEALPELIPQIVACVMEIVDVLIDNLPLLIEAGMQILFGVTMGIINAIPTLLEKLPEVIDSLINFFIDNGPQLTMAGFQLLFGLIEGLIKAIPEMLKAIPKIIESLFNGLKKGLNKMKEVGKYLVEGLWQGILNAKDWLLDKIKGFASTITDGIKDFFGIASPSRVMRDQVGKFLAQGIGVGFDREMNHVISDMTETAKRITDAISTELDINAMPKVKNQITSQNYYTTKTYQNTTEITKTPSNVVLQMDKKVLGEIMVPVLNERNKVLGVSLS